ncbi:hypothetical protein L249_4378 [Ophiocordyceps polyrhachis-furcata BCC 54312]|uniref:FAD-binding PCMH-type domain-containing protein n=1 Tax=Ophiocordyceps polyrhachis-furcata BCC 54312 TaxID=1330021 RepID=A0A367L7F1_9HYPO|nr:hypothetical protein L249_4378 [Ophiocordyceps polyrhachis-furcata BCC 54312]
MALKTLWARLRRRPWPWSSRLGDARTAMLQLLGFASWIPLMIWFNLHVAELTLIDGPSMHPLLNSDWDTTLRRDLVLNHKWNPLNGLKRGMVVTLSPYDPESVLVKRVVALPGDVVQTKPPYQFPLQRVPQGHVWVEGDGAPGTSRDSNTFGPVSMRLLTGRVTHIVYPFQKFGRLPWWERERPLTSHQYRRRCIQIRDGLRLDLTTFIYDTPALTCHRCQHTMKLITTSFLLHTATAWARLFTSPADSFVRDLSPLLSEGATVLLSSSAAAAPLLKRNASPRISPGYVAVVEIKYANRHGMPFLAVSGGHGWLSTLNRLQGGIQINMRKMNHTRLNADGKTANVGGGTLQREITAALFAEGKRAGELQPAAERMVCVSAIGPLLGGGHSLLQARHGFAADNLVSARVVLADGSVVTASAKEEADLFWGIRGAGHNFGIVTSFDVKAYDAQGRWAITRLVFTHDKLEELPVIHLRILSEGDAPVINEFKEAFRRLRPTRDSTVEGLSWGQVHASGTEAKSCDINQNMMGFPSSFRRWDAAALRRAFDLLSELTADATFASSRILLQSYGNKGVRDVPDSANAVAPEERRYNLLLAATLTWRGEDQVKLAKARDFGNRMQNVTTGADGLHHSYLNYAQGHEAVEEVYGRDWGRIGRLRGLKRRFDPLNRFGFYMPL